QRDGAGVVGNEHQHPLTVEAPGETAGERLPYGFRVERATGRRRGLREHHTPPKAEYPPSTGITVPVTKRLASEANHRSVPTRSSGSPKRPIGVWAMIWRPRSVRSPSGFTSRARFCSPRKKPGAMALTRRPSP